MRTVSEARRHIQGKIRNKVRIEPGTCKKSCREAYLIDSDGSKNAKQSYARTDHRFSGMWIPGAFAWYQVGEDWHVAICAFRKGYVFSTDLPNEGFWGRVPLMTPVGVWGAKFLGFSRDIDGRTPVKVPRIVRRYP